jgi:hypothetical protein
MAYAMDSRFRGNDGTGERQFLANDTTTELTVDLSRKQKPTVRKSLTVVTG